MEHITSQGILVTNRVFVGGIPSWMNEIKLQLQFEEMNLKVKDTRIVEDMKTGRPKGYGFVTFFETKVAEELIREGHVRTKDGLQFRISQAIRKKALELRKRQQMTQKICQNSYNLNQQYMYLPIQTAEARPLNVYAGGSLSPCGSYYLNLVYPEQYYTNSLLSFPQNNSSGILQ